MKVDDRFYSQMEAKASQLLGLSCANKAQVIKEACWSFTITVQKVKREFEIYEFNELSEGAQAKVLEKLSDINVDGDYWFEPIIEQWQGNLERFGYLNADISFTGFSSQGDGASFKAEIDLQQWTSQHSKEIKAKVAKLDHDNTDGVNVLENIIGFIKKSGHYEHEYTMSVYLEPDGLTSVADDTILDELADIILADARTLAKQIYRELEKAYYSYTSREAVIETITSNGYRFFKDGKMFNL